MADVSARELGEPFTPLTHKSHCPSPNAGERTKKLSWITQTNKQTQQGMHDILDRVLRHNLVTY